MKQKSELWIKRARLIAKRTLKNSYAPYSGYHVAAVVKLKSGLQIAGCNIENASYGGTVCAERVAIWKALSEGQSKIEAIFVLSEGRQPWPPCGFCRQVMAEFMPKEALVICENLQGKARHFLLGDLLPEAFTPKDLKN